MQDRTIRTIGASVVLIGLIVAGIIQIGTAEQPAAAEIGAVGAQSGTVPSTAPGASSTDRPASTTAPEPFTYRIGVLAGVSTDNFWAYYGDQPSVWNSYVHGPTKPSLYSLDAGTGRLTPDLALGDASPRWDASGWRVRVALNPERRWSDGTPITAEDFVFTFDTVRDLGLGGSWADAYPDSIESVHADGPHELRIEFGERPNLSVWPHGAGLAPLMPAHVWAEQTEGIKAKQLYKLASERDVSGGPLTLALVTEDLVVSHANDWHPDAVAAASVEYHVYEDEKALIAAVVSGEVHSVLTPKGLTSEQVAEVAGAPGVEIVDSPANGVRYLGFNLKRQPMADQAFRTALALLLDRESLAGEISNTEVAWSFVPRANDQWFNANVAAKNRDEYTGKLGDRLEKALDDLRAAGYAWKAEPSISKGVLVAGEGLTIRGQTPQPLTILTPGDAYDPARPDYVRAIAETLALLGFDARPVETDFDSVVDLAFTEGDDGEMHFDMYLLGWTLGSPDLPGFYRPFFGEDGVLNNTGYQSETFNAALADFEDAYSTSEARKALWDMERTLATDLPYLLLYRSELTEIYRSDQVTFDVGESLGGLQGRLGGIGDVRPSN